MAVSFLMRPLRAVTRDSLLRSFITLRSDGEVINDNSRLRHPREEGTTESGICFI